MQDGVEVIASAAPSLSQQASREDWYTANMSPATAGLATSLFRRHMGRMWGLVRVADFEFGVSHGVHRDTQFVKLFFQSRPA